MAAFDLPPEDAPEEGFLDQLLADSYPAISRVRPPGAPQSFLEGLGQGFVGGLASRGERVARQRAIFDERQRQRQALVDKARLEQANRAAALEDRRTLSQEEFDRANPELTPEDISAFPAGTAGSRLRPGTRLPLSKRADLMSEETQAQKESAIAGEARARARGAAEATPDQLMDNDTIKFRVGMFLAGGSEPAFGNSKNGVANKVAFNTELKRQAAAQGLSGADVVTGRASFVSNQKSLSQLQPLLDSSTAWSNTAEKNTGQYLSKLRKVADAGSPWINKPLRSINRNVLGSADQAAFDAALKVIIPEYSRLLSSPSAGGVLSDSAREEGKSILNDSHSAAQILAVIEVLKNDAKNRTSSYKSQINDIKWRMAHPGKERPSLEDLDR